MIDLDHLKTWAYVETITLFIRIHYNRGELEFVLSLYWLAIKDKSVERIKRGRFFC